MAGDSYAVYFYEAYVLDVYVALHGLLPDQTKLFQVDAYKQGNAETGRDILQFYRVPISLIMAICRLRMQESAQ